MTHLHKMMLEELQRRNYSKNTARSYLSIVRDFAKHFHNPPDQLGLDEIRQYQAYLIEARKLEPARSATTLRHSASSSARPCSGPTSWTSSRIRKGRGACPSS